MEALFQTEHEERPCGKRLINDGEEVGEKEKRKKEIYV